MNKYLLTEIEYKEMLLKFELDEITIDEWKAYCLEYLNKLMELNQEVLKRLKNI